MPCRPPGGPCRSPASPDWSSFGDLSRRQLCRVRVGGRRWGQLRHLRPVDRRRISAASDGRCGRRPRAGVVAGRSTHRVRACPERKTGDFLKAGARRRRAAPVRGRTGNWGLVFRPPVEWALVDARWQAAGLWRSEWLRSHVGDLLVLVRGWSETPAHTSAHESQRHSPRRFSRWPLSRVRSHEPVRPWRQRLSAEARAAATVGGADPTDVRP